MANSFEQESENSLRLEAIGTSIGGSIPSPSKSESIDLEYSPFLDAIESLAPTHGQYGTPSLTKPHILVMVVIHPFTFVNCQLLFTELSHILVVVIHPVTFVKFYFHLELWACVNLLTVLVMSKCHKITTIQE